MPSHNNNYNTRGLAMASVVALSLLGLLLLAQREDVAVVVAHDASHEAGIFSDASILTQWPRMKELQDDAGPVEVNVGPALGLLGTGDDLSDDVDINNNKAGGGAPLQEHLQVPEKAQNPGIPALERDLHAMQHDERAFEKAVSEAGRASREDHPEDVDAFMQGAKALQLMGQTSRELDLNLKRAKRDAKMSVTLAHKHAMRIAAGTGASNGPEPPWAELKADIKGAQKAKLQAPRMPSLKKARPTAAALALQRKQMLLAKRKRIMMAKRKRIMLVRRMEQERRVKFEKKRFAAAAAQQKRAVAASARPGESPLRLAATLDALTRATGPIQTHPSVQHTELMGGTAKQMPMDVNPHPQMPAVRLASPHPQVNTPPHKADRAPAVKERYYRGGAREVHEDDDEKAVFARESAEKAKILPSERRQKAAFLMAEKKVADRYSESEKMEQRADSEEKAAKAREALASQKAQKQVAKQQAAHRAAISSWQKTLEFADHVGTEKGTKTEARKETSELGEKNVAVRKTAEARMDAEAAKARKKEAAKEKLDAVEVEHRRLARFRRKAEELVTKAADKQADKDFYQQHANAAVPPGATPGF